MSAESSHTDGQSDLEVFIDFGNIFTRDYGRVMLEFIEDTVADETNLPEDSLIATAVDAIA